MHQDHPNLSPQINANIRESELAGGIFVKDLPVGKGLRIQTANTLYILRRISDKDYTIEGNQRFCPKPEACCIHGSTWGGSMIKIGFIGRDMHLEFSTVEYPQVTTSVIKEITEID